MINLLTIGLKRINGKKYLTKPHVIIFEGWCVGATPQKNKDLLAPINILEKEKDKKRIWRNWVNKELKTNIKKYLNDRYIYFFKSTKL